MRRDLHAHPDARPVTCQPQLHSDIIRAVQHGCKALVIHLLSFAPAFFCAAPHLTTNHCQQRSGCSLAIAQPLPLFAAAGPHQTPQPWLSSNRRRQKSSRVSSTAAGENKPNSKAPRITIPQWQVAPSKYSCDSSSKNDMMTTSTAKHVLPEV